MKRGCSVILMTVAMGLLTACGDGAAPRTSQSEVTATATTPNATAAAPAAAPADAAVQPKPANPIAENFVMSPNPDKVEKIQKTDAEWKAILTPEQYAILREKGTERPFTGALVDEHRDGTYVCAACGLALYKSGSKFDSGCGWPSFAAPIAKDRMETHVDTSHGMVRTEIVCPRCGGHLGHVFDDGPIPLGGMRHCVNSASIKFVPKDDADKAAAPTPAAPTKDAPK